MEVLITIVVGAILFMVSRNWISVQPNDHEEHGDDMESEAVFQEFEMVPLEEKLQQLILETDDLSVEHADSEYDNAELGPVTNRFFSQYRRFSRRSIELASDSVGPAEYFDGCISLGHYEYWEIIVRRKSDVVYVVDGTEGSLSQTDSRYSSIYHFLIEELS